MKKFLRDTNIDAERFRAGMAQLTGAVNIIATRNGEVRSGLTASAVCSFSSEPPRLLACVNFSGNSFQHIAESRCMSVNVLAQSQERLAKRFAGMLDGKHEDRFNYGKWTELVTGAPVLEEALAGFDCTVEEMLVAHTPRGHYRRGEGRDREQRPEAPALLKTGRLLLPWVIMTTCTWITVCLPGISSPVAISRAGSGMLSRPAVNTSLYVHCAHPWAQPCGRLAPCKSSVLTICYHPLSLRMIVLKAYLNLS